MDAFLLLFFLLPLASAQLNFCPPDQRPHYDNHWKKVVEEKTYYQISHLIENYIKQKWRVWAEFEYLYTKGVEYNLPKCSNDMAPCKPCKCSSEPLGQWRNYPQVEPSQILSLVSGKITCGGLKFSDSTFSKQLLESLGAKNQRCPEKNVWDCSTDCATACYCSNCREDPCCNYLTYGQRLDCLLLGQNSGPRPGYGSTPVKIGQDRNTRVIDLPSGMSPLIPAIGDLLKNATNNKDEEQEETGTIAPTGTTTPSPILKLLEPLPNINTQDAETGEAFYKNFSRKIAEERKREEKKLQQLVGLLKKEWRAIAIRNKALERRMSLLEALRQRDKEISNRLQYLRQKKQREEEKKKKKEKKKEKEKKDEEDKFSKEEKEKLEEDETERDIMNVARNMRRKATYLECRLLVQRQGKCFETMTDCILFVKRKCVQSKYRQNYVNELLCASVSC